MKSCLNKIILCDNRYVAVCVTNNSNKKQANYLYPPSTPNAIELFFLLFWITSQLLAYRNKSEIVPKYRR